MLPPSGHNFEVNVEKDVHKVHRYIQRLLTAYKDEKKGPTLIAIQSCWGNFKDLVLCSLLSSNFQASLFNTNH